MNNDNELNSIFSKIDMIKSKVNIIDPIETRELYDNQSNLNINKNKSKINSLNDESNLNFSTPSQIAGIYYQPDIQSNEVLLSQQINNNILNNNDTYDRNKNQLSDILEDSYGIPSLKGDTNISSITKRDDYYRNRPTGNLYQEGLEKKLFLQNKNKMDVIQDNKINFKEKTTNKNSVLLRKEYKNIPPLYPNIDINNISNSYIEEELLMIDSKDRDYSTNEPNIFNFKINFKGIADSAGAVFRKDLEKIRYIKLNKILVPNYYQVQKVSKILSIPYYGSIISFPATILSDSSTYSVGTLFDSNTFKIIYRDGTTFITFINMSSGYYYGYDGISVYYLDNNDKGLYNDKFLLLNVTELNKDNYATNTDQGNSFGLLYPEKLQNNYLYINSFNSGSIFKFSNLKNLYSLTIKLKNSLGEDLTSSGSEENTDKTNQKDIRSPIFFGRQIHLVFKVGLYKIEQNIKQFV